MFCVRHLLLALSDGGFVDDAYGTVNREDYPSYGYMLKQNATTIWESWFFSNDTFSHNHPMFSSVAVWFQQVLAGIRAPGSGSASEQQPSASTGGSIIRALVISRPAIPSGAISLGVSALSEQAASPSPVPASSKAA